MTEKMNFLKLCDLYQKDTTITRENITAKLFEAPVLHGIYSKWLYKWRVLLINADKKRALEYKKLYYYYKNDYEHILDKKELIWHIETHEDYVDLNRKHKILKNEVDQIESFVKHCANLSYFTNTIVEYEKHLSGK